MTYFIFQLASIFASPASAFTGEVSPLPAPTPAATVNAAIFYFVIIFLIVGILYVLHKLRRDHLYPFWLILVLLISALYAIGFGFFAITAIRGPFSWLLPIWDYYRVITDISRNVNYGLGTSGIALILAGIIEYVKLGKTTDEMPRSRARNMIIAGIILFIAILIVWQVVATIGSSFPVPPVGCDGCI
jgi:hypothetical protein